MKAVMEAAAERVKERIGAIRHPETGEFPTVVVMGDSIDNLNCKVEGSPELLALIKERLDDNDEITLVETIPTSAGSPRVFLSYGSEDHELAEKIANKLQDSGVDTWWAKWCIGAGDSLRQKIDEGLDDCTHFIVLLTPASLKKPWVNQEMDAGLVGKIRERCEFIPLRHDLPAKELPPLISGILSPDLSSDFDGEMTQLVNDIHGVVRKPPSGAPPEAVKQYEETNTGCSPAVTTVAKLFVESTEHALFADPQTTVSEIAKQTNLPEENVDDALHELGGLGLVKKTRLTNGVTRVLAKDELFVTFDKFWKPWDPEKDAVKVAADMLNDDGFPAWLEEIGERYGWEPRCVNPAAAYLINRDVVKRGTASGTGCWLAAWIYPNGDATRRFVKSRTS